MENINLFIRTLAHVLGSGMRLILVGLNDIGMVHPNARVSDKIYCIEGCSIAVVLREDVTSNGSKAYRVIGGAQMRDWDHYENFSNGGQAPSWFTETVS
jgi:hypothetical protein